MFSVLAQGGVSSLDGKTQESIFLHSPSERQGEMASPAKSIVSFRQDDVLLKDAARQVTADFNRYVASERVECAESLEERARLARELHDGVLQSLAGAAFQLEALAHHIDANEPVEAHKLLHAIDALLSEEQRRLRIWVQQLKSAPSAATRTGEDLLRALEPLCRRLEQRWKIGVRLSVGRNVVVPRSLGDEIYRLVQEGLNNIGRHARAHVGRVEIRRTSDSVRILIADDGIGFSFHGRYDLGKLAAQRTGPKSLQERVISLTGQLVLTSTSIGSRVDVTLPLLHGAAPSGQRINDRLTTRAPQ